MAHIATCLAPLEPPSPLPLQASSLPPSPNKPHSWRMLPPEQEPKYNLFPKIKQPTPLASTKPMESDKAIALKAQAGSQAEKASAAAHLRLRTNQHGQPRRRKANAPDTGVMTTVQEDPIDSPTIPGCPPLHERSSSLPGLQTIFASNYVPNDARNGIATARDGAFPKLQEPTWSAAQDKPPSSPTAQVTPPRNRPSPLPQPIMSSSKLRSGSAPPRQSPRPALLEASPLSRMLYTPSCSTPDLSLPTSATTESSSITALTTPTSAPMVHSHGALPGPWEGSGVCYGCAAPHAESSKRGCPPSGHRRRVSESSSIMDRGRPRQRADMIVNRATKSKNTNSPLPPTPSCDDCKRDKSIERRAFEELPHGLTPSEAPTKLTSNDVVSLQRQAQRQAARFEILRVSDVEALSKELRQLDERTEQLRRTYASLRAGRRNMHNRICQYLRSPRSAQFSPESMLKQEDALTELDASIDEWIAKLEHAENRRTRIRQKLLEHVAAAALLPIPVETATSSESLQQVMGVRSTTTSGISTPPRSPERQSPPPRAQAELDSPKQAAVETESVLSEPSFVEAVAEAAELNKSNASRRSKRAAVESIRVYMKGDVFSLLADVEDEITRMNVPSSISPLSPIYQEMEPQEQEKGHDGGNERQDVAPSNVASSPLSPRLASPVPRMSICTTKAQNARAGSITPPPPTPPLKDFRPTENEVFLTPAVFRP
ncbi:hypothetical protein HIM_01011 [Hirsutella minnesotensis 3608]|nr:hypothetical protein HIM_01011 [Hirsutella minnesotensis 3608]